MTYLPLTSMCILRDRLLWHGDSRVEVAPVVPFAVSLSKPSGAITRLALPLLCNNLLELARQAQKQR